MVRDSFILQFRIYINLFRINELIFLIINYYKTTYYQPYRFIGGHCALRLNVPLLQRFHFKMPDLQISNSLSMKYFCSPRSRRPYNSFSSAAPDTLETALISIKDHKELAPSDQKNILQTDVSVPEACSSKNKSIPIITQVDRINLGLTNVVSLQLHNPEAISPIPIFLPSTPSSFDSFGPLIEAPIRPLSPTPIFLSSAASPFDF